MTESITKELLLPQSREQVWRALATSEALAEWLLPNDFEARLGHKFTFQVPPNPKTNFDGMAIHCEVLECEPPSRLAFSWVAGGFDTRVSFRLEADGEGTRLLFEHSGFDSALPRGEQARKGAKAGWNQMLGKLPDVVQKLAGADGK
jgi:uncharacterized protein YndB with AHSA1/START domain